MSSTPRGDKRENISREETEVIMCPRCMGVDLHFHTAVMSRVGPMVGAQCYSCKESTIDVERWRTEAVLIRELATEDGRTATIKVKG